MKVHYLEKRQTERLFADLPIEELNSLPRPISGVLTDISEHGCRIETFDAEAPAAHQRVGFVLLGHGYMIGEVMWCHEHIIGIRFCNPIDRTAVEHFVRLSLLERLSKHVPKMDKIEDFPGSPRLVDWY